jgi:probable F420-dependent oxidoreductase
MALTGRSLLLQGFTVTDTVELAREAEQAGYRDVWIAESNFTDAFIPAAATAVNTKRIRVATGIVGVYGRTAAVMALSASSLAQLSGGRAVLGLGVQAKPYVENWHGVPFDKPLSRLRDYVEIVRRAVRGEQVTWEGRSVSVRGFELLAEPRDVPIYLAAMGPKSIQLAGEVADGVIGAFYSPDYLRQTVHPNLEIGARRAGRSLDGFDVASIIPMLISDDPAARQQMKPRLLMSVTALRSSPAYKESFVQAGFGLAADAAIEAVRRGDVAAGLRAIPDEVVDQLTVCGGQAELERCLACFAAAGLTTAVLQPTVPNAFYPYYEDHFGPGVEFPDASYQPHLPAILRGIRACSPLLA